MSDKPTTSPPDWEHDFAMRKLKGSFPHLSAAEIAQALQEAKQEAAPSASHDDILLRAEQKLSG